MAKLELKFNGLDSLLEKMERLSNHEEVKRVAGLALQASYEYVQANVKEAVESSKFNFERTGETAESILEGQEVFWNASIGSIGVGFDISGKKTGHIGLPSIFLMYGTPRIEPDTNLYDAVYGSKTKSKIKKIQAEIFNAEIARLMS